MIWKSYQGNKMKKNKTNKFKTPEGYFESFNERLKQRLEGEVESQSDLIPKTDGFAVPEDYFEKLNGQIQSKIASAAPKVITLTSYRTFYYAAAAVAVLFVLVFAWNTDQNSIEFDDLANAEITAYFEEEDFGLSSYEIAEVLPIGALSIDDMTEIPLEEENILEYLDENVADFEELNLDYDELEE